MMPLPCRVGESWRGGFRFGRTRALPGALPEILPGGCRKVFGHVDLFLGHAVLQPFASLVVDSCEVGPGVGKVGCLGS